MRRFLQNKIIKTLILGVVALVVLWGGMCLFGRRATGDESLINIAELSDEFMEQYFDDYAEMTSKGDQENLLVVVSYERPNGYGAVDVVEAPNHTYFMMYNSAEARDTAYERLKADDLVSVEKNEMMQLAENNSWGVSEMGLDVASAKTGYSHGYASVAIIDTGLDMVSFRNLYPERGLSAYDVETGESSWREMKDDNGHGTHVAGIVADGTPGSVSLMIIRAVRDGYRELSSADVTTGIYRAIDYGAEVINLSLGSYNRSDSQELALKSAKGGNIVAVAAAGNDKTSNTIYPAGYDCTISVSAVNSNLSFASSYSNYGSTIDFAAPGTDVMSINGKKSGTSMAAPHVAAAAAILKIYNNRLPVDTTKEILKQYARDLGDSGWDQYYGYGFIDLSEVDFCDSEYCDESGVFDGEVPEYVKAEIEEVTLTSKNYYSIQNLMLTEVNLYTDATNYVTKKLQEVDNLEIIGYNPESTSQQEVEIRCGSLSTSVMVTNPAEYESGWEYDVNENNEIMLTKYINDRHEEISRVYVPSRIDGKNVVRLVGEESGGDAAFQQSYDIRDQIEEVYLPETLTSVGENMFDRFWVLRKVVMEADLVRLGDEVFRNDEKLKTVEGKIVELGENTFFDNILLESIELAEGLTEIPSRAFGNCTSLKGIRIPSTVTSIGWEAFAYDYSLETLEFAGNNLRVIEWSAFGSTAALNSANLPEGLEEIENYAFEYSGISSVYIPASVETIGNEAFSNCSDLATIVVANGNQKYYDVDDKALMQDNWSGTTLITGTKSFTIPATTTRIGSNAFARKFTSIALAIPDSVKYIDYRAFYGCTGLTIVAIPKTTSIGSGVFALGEDKNGDYVNLDAIMFVYNDSLGYDYAVNEQFDFETIDASYARVVDEFEYGETLTNNTEVEMYYDYGETKDGVYTKYTGIGGRKEVRNVSNFVSTAYSGNYDYFRIGDTFFTATYVDYWSKNATIDVEVTVNGELPEPELPEGLVGKLRASLYTVELPEGFSWMDSSTSMDELGEHTYLARYVPENVEMYAPMDNVEITVEVLPMRTKLPDPEIILENKLFDDSWNIDAKYITINIDGLTNDDFYAYAYTDDYEVGTTTARVYIYLNWNVGEDYGFGDNYDYYYEYVLDGYEILPAPIVDVDNLAEGIAKVEVLDDGIMVTADEACMVIISRDGGETYEKVSTIVATENENQYKFEFGLAEGMDVKVVLKGDGDLDGMVTPADFNRLNRSLISPTLGTRYRALTDIEKLLFDLDGDDEVTPADLNTLNRALISPTLGPRYKKIQW